MFDSQQQSQPLYHCTISALQLKANSYLCLCSARHGLLGHLPDHILALDVQTAKSTFVFALATHSTELQLPLSISAGSPRPYVLNMLMFDSKPTKSTIAICLAGDGKELQLPLVPKEVFKVVVPTCALAREGLEALESAVLAAAGAPELAAGGVSWAVNERQAEALVRAHEALMRVRGGGARVAGGAWGGGAGWWSGKV